MAGCMGRIPLGTAGAVCGIAAGFELESGGDGTGDAGCDGGTRSGDVTGGDGPEDASCDE